MTVPSLGPQLDSARAKLRRANQQIRALKKSMQRFVSRDLYDNRAEAYNPGFAYLPVRTVKVRARKRISPMGLQYTEAAHERLFIKTVGLRMSLVPRANFSAQY